VNVCRFWLDVESGSVVLVLSSNVKSPSKMELHSYIPIITLNTARAAIVTIGIAGSGATRGGCDAVGRNGPTTDGSVDFLRCSIRDKQVLCEDTSLFVVGIVAGMSRGGGIINISRCKSTRFQSILRITTERSNLFC
jgi:hypothetical protein